MKFSIWKTIIIAVIAVIIVTLLSAPYVIRNQINSNSKEWFVRKIDISALNINYFTSTIDIAGFKYYEPNDSDIFVSFDTLLINLEPLALLSNNIKIEDLRFSGLTINIEFEDSTFNFNDIIEYYTQTDTNSIPTTEDSISEGNSFNIEISNIHFNSKLIKFTDNNIHHSTELNDLNINIPEISFGNKSSSKSDIFFYLNNETSINSNIDFNFNTNDINTTIEISNFNLASYFPFIKSELNISSIDGLLNTKLNIAGNINEIDKLIIKGDILLNNFEATDTNNNKLIGLKHLKVGMSNINTYSNQYTFDSILIDKPYIAFDLYKNNKTNYDNLLKEQTTVEKHSTPNTDTSTTSKSLNNTINSFTISEGNIDFKDFTTSKVFKYNLSQIKLGVKDIKSSSEWVKSQLSILMNGRGKMLVNFGFNPQKPKDMEIDYSMKNFKLSDVNIYTVQQTAYPFKRGDLFYFSKTTVRNGIIKSNNKIQINDPEVGEKVEGINSIPLKLAIYLEKDRNNEIHLDVPIEGNINDPGFSLRKIVWDAFKNVIIKIATSPYDLIASETGVNVENIKEIKFDYLDTNLTQTINSQIKDLILIEKTKPDLIIELNYSNDVKAEKKLIAIQEAKSLQIKLATDDNKIRRMSFEEFIDYKNPNINMPDLGEKCIRIIGDAQVNTIYENYYKIRKAKLYKEIKAQNLGSEIKINDLSNSKDNLGTKPSFIIKYNIKE